MSQLLAAGSPSTFWYVTRASGAVALLLLTASICLGIATTVKWRTSRLPRFAVAGLHRSLTLMSIVFVALHVATTVLDGYAPIAWQDAVVPFLSAYRPFWLGLGAVAFDLLLALVLTSLLRARIGHRVWRATHWLAYASWPVALLHALGTGSDSRSGWLQTVAFASALSVLLALAMRCAVGPGSPVRRLGATAGALAIVLGVGVWYRGGPGAHGWAARAGTPSALLARAVPAQPTRTTRTALVSFPSSFASQFVGRLTNVASADRRIDVHIDGTLRRGIRGRLRLVLEGVPLEDEGVSMTASGVSFAAAGLPSVYQGRITGLEGTRISARVSSGSNTIDLRITLRLEPGRARVTGVVDGSAA